MYNLILKDLLIQKKTFIFAAFYSFIVFFAFKEPTFSVAMYTMGIVTISYLFVMSAVAYDDKNKSEIILNSLPLKRSHIIIAKFLSIFVYVALSSIMIALIGLVLKFTGFFTYIRFINLIDILASFISVGILSSFYLPLYYKFGRINIQIFNIFLFFIIFLSPAFISKYFKENTSSQIVKDILTTLNSMPDWLFTSIFSAAILIFMFISMLITIKIYNNKDF